MKRSIIVTIFTILVVTFLVYAQGNPPGLHDAWLIRGKKVQDTTGNLTDNEILKYDAAKDSLIWETDVSGAGGSDSSLFLTEAIGSGTRTAFWSGDTLIFKLGANRIFGFSDVGATVKFFSFTNSAYAFDDQIDLGGDRIGDVSRLQVDSIVGLGTSGDLFIIGGVAGDILIHDDIVLRWTFKDNRLTGEANASIVTDSLVGIGGIITSPSQLFIDGTTNQPQLRIQAHSTQDSDIVRIENSAGTALMLMDSDGELEIIHVASHIGSRALKLEMDGAGIGTSAGMSINLETGAISAGEENQGILVNVDQSASTGGDVHGFEMLSTSTGSAAAVALVIGTGVNVITHHSGVFGNLTFAEKRGSGAYTDWVTEGNSTALDITLWDAVNDTVFLGFATKFEELSWNWEIDATKDMSFTFAFSIAGPAFTVFSPTDGTNGARNSGNMAWDADDLASWASISVDGDAAFWIAIIRTKIPGTGPTEDIVKIAAPTDFNWTTLGDVSVHSIIIDSMASNTGSKILTTDPIHQGDTTAADSAYLKTGLAVLTDGSNALTANWAAGDFDITGIEALEVDTIRNDGGNIFVVDNIDFGGNNALNLDVREGSSALTSTAWINQGEIAVDTFGIANYSVFKGTADDTLWWKIAVLPVNGLSTGDHLQIDFYYAEAAWFDRYSMRVELGNRSGFNGDIVWSTDSLDMKARGGIQCFQDQATADSVVDVYIVIVGTGNFAGVQAQLTSYGWGKQARFVDPSDFDSTETNPIGAKTLVFNTLDPTVEPSTDVRFGHLFAITIDSVDALEVDTLKSNTDTVFVLDPLKIKDFALYTGGNLYAQYDSADVPTNSQQLTWITGNIIRWEDQGAGGGGSDTSVFLADIIGGFDVVKLDNDTLLIYEGTSAALGDTLLKVYLTVTNDTTIWTAEASVGWFQFGPQILFSDVVVFNNDILFEGVTIDNNELTFSVIDPTADRTMTFPDDQVAPGDILVGGATVGGGDLLYLALGNTQIIIGDGTNEPTAAALSGDATMGNTGILTIAANVIDTGMIDFAITLASNVLGAGESFFATTGIIFEGATANAFEGLLTLVDPTTPDKTWTLPDKTGDIALIQDFNTANFVIATGDVQIKSGGVNSDEILDNTVSMANDMNTFTKAQLATQTTDVVEFGEADGEVWTGVHDFGGATSLEIPNATNPAATVVGHVFFDTDDSALAIFDGAREVLVPVHFVKEFTIWNPDLVTDTIPVIEVDSMLAQAGITLESFSATTSVDGTYTLNLYEFTGADPPVRVGAGTIATLGFAAADQRDATQTFSDDGIARGNHVYILTPATDIDWVKVKIRYFINAND